MKLKIQFLVNLDLANFELPKQPWIPTSGLGLTSLQADLALGPKTKFVLLHSKFNFY